MTQKHTRVSRRTRRNISNAYIPIYLFAMRVRRTVDPITPRWSLSPISILHANLNGRQLGFLPFIDARLRDGEPAVRRIFVRRNNDLDVKIRESNIELLILRY